MASKYDEVFKKMRTALISIGAIDPKVTDPILLMDEVDLLFPADDDPSPTSLIAGLLNKPPHDYKKAPQKALFAEYFIYNETARTISLTKTAARDSFAPSISVPSGATRELSMSNVTRGTPAKLATKKASPKKKAAKKGTISKGVTSKVASGKKTTKKVAAKKVTKSKGA